jgi:hypothetical protein
MHSQDASHTTPIVGEALALQRRSAVRVGWNDAAWAQPRRNLDPDLAAWYARGYAGGLVYLRKQQPDISDESRVVAEPHTHDERLRTDDVPANRATV